METTTVQSEVEQAINEIRPLLAGHHGDIELVKVEEGVVYIKMLGMCDGCPLAGMTLKNGIEELVKMRVPEITSVEAV